MERDRNTKREKGEWTEQRDRVRRERHLDPRAQEMGWGTGRETSKGATERECALSALRFPLLFPNPEPQP